MNITIENKFDSSELLFAIGQKVKSRNLIKTINFIILFSALAFMLIFFGIINDSLVLLVSGILIASSMVLALITSIYKKFLISNKKRIDKSSIEKEYVNYKYIFKDDCVEISIKSNVEKSSNTLKYTNFLYYSMNENYIYLYITKVNCYVLRVKDTTEELLKHLETKIRKR